MRRTTRELGTPWVREARLPVVSFIWKISLGIREQGLPEGGERQSCGTGVPWEGGLGSLA